MARRTRVEYEGAVYHVMDRGDRQESIFRDDEDRRLFLRTLGAVCQRTGWKVHAYVLMGNHYHLLVETPEPNLSRGMHWFQATYTIRHNARHRLRGHVFQGRYKATPVDAESGSYFVTATDYIHLNPARAGLLAGGALAGYEWSSFPALTGESAERPAWLCGERLLNDFGSRDDAEGRKRYRQSLEERVAAEASPEEDGFQSLRRGWCHGSEEFQRRLAGVLGSGEKPAAMRSRPHHEAAAEEDIRRLLAGFGLRSEDLTGLPKNDPRKIAMAWVVRRNTTVSNGWLAWRLHMGSPSRVSRYCSEVERSGREMGVMFAVAKAAMSKA